MTRATYATRRAAERRGDCLTCGVSDDACTAKVLAGRAACCSTCAYTDTHPRPDGTHDGAPCTHCHGTGIEPAEEP